MKLQTYQRMGEPSPYKTGVWDAEESDLEEDSDDDLIQEEMSNDQLQSTINDIVKQIFESQSYTVDVALINLKQIKHGYSKDNFDFTDAIYPAMFNYISTNLLKADFKNKERQNVVDQTITKYLQMFTTFVTSQDEQQNAIYQTALACSKQELLKTAFSIVMQLCYQKEIFSGEAVLKWIET